MVDQKPPFETLNINDVSFPLAADVDEFCRLAEKHNACVIQVPTAQYGKVVEKARDYFTERCGWESNEVRQVYNAKLICAGCSREFPPSFQASLLGTFDIIGMPIGISPETVEFARTACCPVCGSTRSYCVYGGRVRRYRV